MGFSQVVEENGVKKLTPITTPTSVTAQEAKTLALEAKALAEAALPKAGGEVKGSLMLVSSNMDITTAPVEAISDRSIYIQDKNKQNLALLSIVQQGNTNTQMFAAYNKKADETKVTSLVQIVANKDGTTYATAPHPRSDNYGSDIVTTKTLKDYAARKMTSNESIHIWPGHADASDTADLFAGRGTADKPFASLRGALSWAVFSSLSGPYTLTMALHADTVLDELVYLYLGGFGIVAFYCPDAPHTITMKGISVNDGCLALQNVNLDITGNPNYGLRATGSDGSGKILVRSNVAISGAAPVVFAANMGGQIIVMNEITGSPAGKKYTCTNGGMIIGASKIPGSEAGICDANSKVIG